MEIEFDPVKRDETLRRRNLDMADAAIVLTGPTLTIPDDRYDYGEDRFITIGKLHERMIILVWTMRRDAYRIISMRKANDREREEYGSRLAGS
jgi:uncharacterized DUF497 family protein